MAVAHDKPKYTVEDYMRLPEGERVELIGGELLVSPSPREKHQRVSAEIEIQIGLWAKQSGLGIMYHAPFDVVLSKHDAVQPDILFISRERKEIITDANVQGAPDLIVEILSPGTEKRDTVAKKALYERHGVREYWIVDPDADTIEVFVARERKFISLRIFSGADILESPALPGFRISLKDVFSTP